MNRVNQYSSSPNNPPISTSAGSSTGFSSTLGFSSFFPEGAATTAAFLEASLSFSAYLKE